jgi:hypothetical protein
MATPVGVPRAALNALLPSPLTPATPDPATVEMLNLSPEFTPAEPDCDMTMETALEPLCPDCN